MAIVDVVIPALNEASSIGLVLAAIPSGLVRKVVVADNGSTDATAEIATRGGAVVVSAPRRGYGSACLAGVAALEASPPEIVVFLDADFSDHPEEMPSLLNPILAGEADLVIGSRLAGHLEPGALLPQARYGNRLACFLIAHLFGVRYTDLGPFRAIRFETLQELGMRDPAFGWTVEMQIKVARTGSRIREVPVSYRRRVGVSKITGTALGTLRAGAKILATIFYYAWIEPRLRRSSSRALRRAIRLAA